MKKWLGYILSVYILLSAIVPCSLFDDCEGDQQTEQQSKKPADKDCTACTPFCLCSSAHNFTHNKMNAAIAPVTSISEQQYSEYSSSPVSAYRSSLFQPPRLG